MSGPLEATDLRSWADEQVDMAPHIWTLYSHAQKAKVIVEWGVRGGVSTWAILDGMPEDAHLWSVDILPCIVPPRVSGDERWTFIIGDDLDPAIQELLPKKADLVFIDTSHTYEQTVGELEYALSLQPDRIVMHDYVMEPVGRAADEFCVRTGWRLIDNELPFGLATLEPPLPSLDEALNP
jgi:predicted O-methyltransferase YrrM